MTRLPGSGTVPRVFALVVLVIVTGFAIAWIATDSGALIAALALEAVALAVAVRSLFVGVLLTPDAILVRGWFADYRYGRDELQAVTAVPYWKFLSKADPILSLLKFTPVKGWVREIATTVAWRDRTAAHAAQIREHLGVPAADSRP
ncbi:MAG: hypothetical protein ABIQ01_11345 [Pseudolysinimonas sp.]